MLKKLTAAILSMLIVLSCSITVFAADSEVTVTYDCNGGTFANSETTKEVVYTLDENGQVTLKNNPPLLRDGYLFKGWYTDAECTNPANQKDKYMTGEAKLYAGWYKISDVDIAPDDTSTSVTKADGSELVGVQMRMTDAGLRFVSRISRRIKTDLAKLSDDKVKYGSMLALSDDLPTGTMLTDSAKKSSGEAFNKFYAEKNYYVTRDYALYTDVVINITIDKFKTRIACRPFVEYTDANGFTQTYYYTEPETSSHYLGGGYAISLYELAEYINENTDMEQDQKDILKKYIIDNYDEYLKYNDPADDDGDGLTNGEEYQYGTDKDKVDTDGDGLNDKLEIDLGYDPLKVDSFGDGINDGDRDYDNDGLTNLQEISLKTDLQSADTDNDGINDGDEVNKYGTDPLKKDTDGDGFYDYDEIKAGTDPLDAKSPGTGKTIDVPAIVINAPSNPLLEEPKKRKKARSADDGTVTYHDPEEEKNHTPGVKEIFEVDPGEKKGVVVGTIPALDEGKDTKDQTDLYKYNPDKCYVEKYKTNGSTVELTKGKYYIIKGYDYDLSLASLSKMLNVPDYTTADKSSLDALSSGKLQVNAILINGINLWYDESYKKAWKNNITRDREVEITSRSKSVLAAADGLASVIENLGASGRLDISGNCRIPTNTYPDYRYEKDLKSSQLSPKAHEYAELWDGIKGLLDEGVTVQHYSGNKKVGLFNHIGYDGTPNMNKSTGELIETEIDYYDCDEPTKTQIAPCSEVVVENLRSPEYSLVIDTAQYEKDNWKDPESWLLGPKPIFRPSATPIRTKKTVEASGYKYLRDGDQSSLTEEERDTTYNFYAIDYYEEPILQKSEGDKSYEGTVWEAGESGSFSFSFITSENYITYGFEFITDPDSESAFNAVYDLLQNISTNEMTVNDNLTAFEVKRKIYVTSSATKEDVEQLMHRVLYRDFINKDTDGDGIDEMSKDSIINGNIPDTDWSYVFSDNVAVPKVSNVDWLYVPSGNAARSANTNIVSTGSVDDTITATSGSSTDENILKPEQVLTRDETINTRDWDGDGLYDGDEIQLVTQGTYITNKASLKEIKALIAKTGIVSVNAVNKYFDPDGKNSLYLSTTFVNMISDPCSKDGDKDGIADVKTDENGEIVRNPKVTKVKSSWGYEMEYPEGQPVRLDPLPMDPTSTGVLAQINRTTGTRIGLFDGFSYVFNTDWFISGKENYISPQEYNAELSNTLAMLACLSYRNDTPCTCENKRCNIQNHDKSSDEYINFICTDGEMGSLNYGTIINIRNGWGLGNEKLKRGGSIENLFERLGCTKKNGKFEHYSLWSDTELGMAGKNLISDDPHRGQAYFAIKDVKYKDGSGAIKTKYIVFVSIRGTWQSSEEWISNASIGATDRPVGFNENSKEYGLYGYVKDWTDSEAALGFDVYATRVYRKLMQFMGKQNLSNDSDISFLVTGHSRGAAAANLVSKKLIDRAYYTDTPCTANQISSGSISQKANPYVNSNVYGYTFAAPNTTTASNVGDAKYRPIYNVVNEGDLVPLVPTPQWGFSKYGTRCTFAEEFNFRTNFGIIMNESYKAVEQSVLAMTVGEFSRLATNRNDLYVSHNGEKDTYSKWFDTESNRAALANIVNSIPRILKGLAQIHQGQTNANYPNDDDSACIYYYSTPMYFLALALNCLGHPQRKLRQFLIDEVLWQNTDIITKYPDNHYLNKMSYSNIITMMKNLSLHAHQPLGYVLFTSNRLEFTATTMAAEMPQVSFNVSSGYLTSARINNEDTFTGLLTIPSRVNGEVVTAISSDFVIEAQKATVTEIEIPSTVTLVPDEISSKYSIIRVQG